MTSREFQARLTKRARRAGVVLQPPAGAKLETYFRLLARWSEKINLSGMSLVDPSPDVLDRLLVEPLVAARHMRPGTLRMLDIGSGGGSPAIPIAVSCPSLHLLMVESKIRKSVFLREAIRELEMPQAEVAAVRFEELLSHPDLHEAHDLLTVRAVRLDPRTLMSLQAFISPGGRMFLFRRAAKPETADETAILPMIHRARHPLVESLGSEIVVLEKVQERHNQRVRGKRAQTSNVPRGTLDDQ